VQNYDCYVPEPEQHDLRLHSSLRHANRNALKTLCFVQQHREPPPGTGRSPSPTPKAGSHSQRSHGLRHTATMSPMEAPMTKTQPPRRLEIPHEFEPPSAPPPPAKNAKVLTSPLKKPETAILVVREKMSVNLKSNKIESVRVIGQLVLHRHLLARDHHDEQCAVSISWPTFHDKTKIQWRSKIQPDKYKDLCLPANTSSFKCTQLHNDEFLDYVVNPAVLQLPVMPMLIQWDLKQQLLQLFYKVTTTRSPHHQAFLSPRPISSRLRSSSNSSKTSKSTTSIASLPHRSAPGRQ
jgi:hypothetical protein